VYLLWICCTALRFVVDRLEAIIHCFDLLSSPQQIHNILTYRDVVDMSKSRKVVDVLWICCEFAIQLLVQQIEEVEFELYAVSAL
jgi:hypothetical protein